MFVITLVSNTQIINKIFSLIANKLALELIIVENCDDIEKSDVIFIDDAFIDENLIKLKSITRSLVLITKDDLIEANHFDTIIKKPFLPSKLQNEIENIIQNLPNNKEELTINNIDKTEDTSSELDSLVDFVDNILDTDAQNNDFQNDKDESLISQDELGRGGVLDKDELSKIFNMVNDDEQDIQIKEAIDEDDWVELADIIDKAIDDVAHYEFKENQPIKLILNQYSIEELKPLLKKLNQSLIDKLTNGEEIILHLKLEK